ncbi:Transport ATP-binding protein CydD [Serinicoccus hydrothermalis]|uniref:Transport ATP-binding protein CydD n=1 Tax=Serinicoccus hydrothermalis TaxID=1758689 RepID=A0A1B1NCC1_9MICO|nr:thiol reductant ABC exporter subunit CydD [Serinicoccus hydrothermalis]ANS79041.1 Transport ATP-binding protein CydD [Serinicoccus hydrothermalis]
MRPVDPALLRSLPATRGPVAALGLVGVASGVVAIAQAVVLALVVGAVARGTGLQAYLVWLVALLVLRGVLAAVGELTARWAGLRVVAVVRAAVLRRWLGRPVEGRPTTEVAITRATEGVAALEPYVARYLPALVTAAVVPALALVTLVVVDPWSALIVVLTLPLLPVFAALIGMHTREQTQRRWGAMELLAGHFLDVMRGLPTLVAYGRARAQVDAVREVGERHRRASVATLRTAFMSTAALELLATISVAMVAVAVGLRLAHGGMDLVVGLTAILLAPEAYWPIRRVGAEFHNAADGAQVLEDLAADGLLSPTSDRTPLPSAPTSDQTPLPSASARTRGVSGREGVRLDAVTYAHPGRAQTLAEVSLATPAPPGLTVLTGPSGAGKTTVLELLAGLRTPASGQVTAPAAHLATQRPLLLPGTVRDNLALAAPDATEKQMQDALDRVGLWAQLADRHGLDTRLGDDGLGLSAGQRARLALARALLSPAPLLLLDEPTANVAADGIPLVHEVLVDLARGRRVVVVTHDPQLAALADDRWSLDGGAGTVLRSRRPGDGSAAPFLHQDDRADAESDAEPDLEPGVVRPIPVPGGRRGLVLACALGGASVGCGVALTATSGWLIVQASTMPVVLTLLVAVVGVRAFGIFRPVFRYAERVVSHDVALADLARRRADLFAALIPLTPARLGRRSRGALLGAMARDLDDVTDEQVRVTVPAWSALIASVLGAAIAGWHLPMAGAVVAAAGLVAAAVAVLGYAAERRAQDDAVRARGRVRERSASLAAELLAVQAVTGRTGGQRLLLDDLAAQEERQRGCEARLTRARAVALTLSWVVVAAAVALVAGIAWSAQAAGTLSAPYAALVALVPVALADTWVGLPEIAGARARARAAARRIEDVLHQEPAVADTGHDEPPAGAPSLELRRVSAAWEPGERAVPDLLALDLCVEPGDRVHLTGPNGAGKSTALAVLARHLDPVSGTYTLSPLPHRDRTPRVFGTEGVSGPEERTQRVSGQEVRELDLEGTRALIALVDDEPHAFAGSVRANLLLAAPGAADADLLDALEAVDLGDWCATLPEGLDTSLTGLSGGERTRLALARAVVSGRPVLLLDEPTAHLDDATAQRALGGVLEHAGADRAVVLVSHGRPPLGRWSTAAVGTGTTRPRDRASTALIG